MFNRLTGRKSKQKRIQYPRQFWLLFYGVFINRGSVSMMWPFLTVYVYQKLDAPLATITLLLTLRAIASMVSTTIVGSLMDRIGRKGIMVASLVGSAGVFLAMTQGDSLLAWAILMALHGLILPIFNIGVNAMVADIVEAEHRAPAYALIRTISNAGIAVGPVIGGTLALIAFELIFVTTAVVYVILAVLVAIMLRETMPDDTELTSEEKRNSGNSDLAPLLRHLITDESELVRGHALWALVQLLGDNAYDTVRQQKARETDADVLAEIDALLA
jgi:MFS family permease